MKKDTCDLLVIGGGPAGSTLAALAKKYAPERRVVLLEKDAGPVHQVGESLLPGLVPVLKEMGAFEAVDSAGFPKKIGATYVWGKDREPWENDFNDINIGAMFERYGKLPERIEYAWQVRRSEYDEILLKQAESLGVEVRRGAAASELVEEGETVVGIRGRDADGPFELRAGLTADCSGQNGFMSRFRKVREYNPHLRNVAAWAYFRGAQWKYVYSGHPDKTKIFVTSSPHGWFWYIPVDKDLVSVGLVTTQELLKEKSVDDPKAFFLDQLKACEELWPLLEKAELVADVEGTGKDFFMKQDWSYLNVAASGPGWLAAGDAAVFVDPILSSGVTLAQLCGHRAAYTAVTAWQEKDESVHAALWKDYDAYCRESAAQYLALALFWYGNDRDAHAWWGRAADIQKSTLPVELSDKGAFIAVAAGLTQHFDRVFSKESLVEENETRPSDFPFYAFVLKESGAEPPKSTGIDRKAVPRLLYPWRTEFSFLPEIGQGRLRGVKKLRFLKHDPTDPVADAFNPRKLVTRLHLDILQAVDGKRSVAEIAEFLVEKGAPVWWLSGPAWRFLADLAVQGVLEWDRQPQESAT